MLRWAPRQRSCGGYLAPLAATVQSCAWPAWPRRSCHAPTCALQVNTCVVVACRLLSNKHVFAKGVHNRTMHAVAMHFICCSMPPMLTGTVTWRGAVAGSVDSGKSTLVACLTHGAAGSPLLDNGHGSARMAVFRHKHEIESGRTSSLSQQLLGYAADGVLPRLSRFADGVSVAAAETCNCTWCNSV
jgi:hypothetical protein